MISLDDDIIGEMICQDARNNIERFETFDTIDSTNKYLLQVQAPTPGMMNVAATTNQTAGRGRHGKVWKSPAGSGLCLSVAYTFATHVKNLPALTLALGIAARDALEELGAEGVQLKWPNDLVAADGKLAGILTEIQEQSLTGATIVAGIGVNIDLDEDFVATTENDWVRCAVDLKSVCKVTPSHDEIAAKLVSCFFATFRAYEKSGFSPLAERWSRLDWLAGRNIQVDIASRIQAGIASGVGDDGALLIQTHDEGLKRITSGTIVHVEPRKSAQ